MPIRISFAGLSNIGQDALTQVASTRYRIMIPGRELARRGYVVVTDGPADVTVFGKWGNPNFPERARALPGAVIYDMCDDCFDTEYGDYARGMIDVADRVTCNTRAMAQRIMDVSGRMATVIPDPYEFPEQAPRFQPAAPPRLMWFGHYHNLDTLADLLPRLAGYPLAVITNAEVENGREEETHILPWSHDNMTMGFDWCDMVIVPTIDTGVKNVKSENRVIESIMSGRYVSAGPLDSYLKFSDWIHIGDVVEGIEEALRQPTAEIVHRIAGAQDFIRANFSVEAVGTLWERVIRKLVPVSALGA